MKTARHDSKDELQYGATPSERSPASDHLLSIFTESDPTTRITNAGPESVVLPITKSQSIDPAQVAQEILAESPLPYTAAAAARVSMRVNRTVFQRPEVAHLVRELASIDISTNRFMQTTSEIVSIERGLLHPTLGLVVKPHPDMQDAVELVELQVGSASHKNIRAWKSRLRGTIITEIEGYAIHSRDDIIAAIIKARHDRKRNVKIIFASLKGFAMSGQGVPTLQTDQLNVIAHHIHTMTTQQDLWEDKTEWPVQLDSQESIDLQLKISKLTRRRLQGTDEWEQFHKSEWKQLNRYDKVEMFGTPIRYQEGMIALPWVWTYIFKENGLTGDAEAKSRGTCNGGPRYGEAVTLAETYASCVEQPIHRLTWALSAALNLTVRGYDVGNAFAEAPAPDKPFYMMVDDQFNEWWTEHLGRDPIPFGYVIPIHKALQGHPEAGRQWDKYISTILTKDMGFTPTIHEPCLYYKHGPNHELTLILRQVDDFLVAGKNADSCDLIRDQLQQRMTNPLNQLGNVRKFNGINVLQTKHYNHLHCAKYIEKITEHHGWTHEKCHSRPIPMKYESKHQTTIQLSTGPHDEHDQSKLQKKMGFNYRQAIGELIYALTVCRIDVSIAVITLSQFSSNPAQVHYDAIKEVFLYLYATRYEGLTYWRPNPQEDLPDRALPVPSTPNLDKFYDNPNPIQVMGACDTTWASDRLQRRSMGGVVLMLAGAAVFYRTHLQPTIAQSSTEAEFTNMADAGKAALYLRWILDELDIIQDLPTPILADNHGAIKMANAQQPTRRTRHVEMKHFVILQWTEDEFLTYNKTRSEDNYSDMLSKPIGRNKFYEQTDILLGRRQPSYTTSPQPSLAQPMVYNMSFSTCRNLEPLNIYEYYDPEYDQFQGFPIHPDTQGLPETLDSPSAGKCKSESLVASE